MNLSEISKKSLHRKSSASLLFLFMTNAITQRVHISLDLLYTTKSPGLQCRSSPTCTCNLQVHRLIPLNRVARQLEVVRFNEMHIPFVCAEVQPFASHRKATGVEPVKRERKTIQQQTGVSMSDDVKVTE